MANMNAGTIRMTRPPGRTSSAMLRSAPTWSSMCSSTLYETAALYSPVASVAGSSICPNVDVRVVGQALLELHQPVRVGLGRGEPREVLRPLEGVVAETAADLDRVVPQVRERQLDEPATVVHGRGEALEHFGLDPLVSSDVCHK